MEISDSFLIKIVKADTCINDMDKKRTQFRWEKIYFGPFELTAIELT